MICPSVKTSPFQWKCEARSIGAFTLRDPTMNPNPASSSAVRFDAESMPASAATTIGVSVRSWRSAKAVMIGTRVVVSAVLPSKQPISKGNPVRSTSRPTTICGSMRRSLEYPTLRRSSSFSASKYSVVTSYNNRLNPPRSAAWVKHFPAIGVAVLAGVDLHQVTKSSPGVILSFMSDPMACSDHQRLVMGRGFGQPTSLGVSRRVFAVGRANTPSYLSTSLTKPVRTGGKGQAMLRSCTTLTGRCQRG